ncbi:hypothetical protein FRC01_008141 [Tulasnella sp. 417]|nr:hypothetical protein FRC01_008141 [Tulasnella sp. 417]
MIDRNKLDEKAHVPLFVVALFSFNNMLLLPWRQNPPAKVYLKSPAPAILREQCKALESAAKDFKRDYREQLLAMYGVLLAEFADNELRGTVTPGVLLALVLDYYFDSTPPCQGRYTPRHTASSTKMILHHFASEAFRRDPAPYLDVVLAQRGTKNVANRYIQLATDAGPEQVLDSRSSWYLLMHLISVQEMQTRLLKDAKMHVTALKTLWKEVSSLPGEQPGADQVARVILVSVSQYVPSS